MHHEAAMPSQLRHSTARPLDGVRGIPHTAPCPWLTSEARGGHDGTVSTNSTSPSHETIPSEDPPGQPAEETGHDRSRGHGHSGHSHSHSGPLDLEAGEVRRVRIVLGVIVGALVLATVVGLFMLWPGKSSLIGSRSFTAEGGSVGRATITSLDLSSCQSAVSALTEVNGVTQDAFAKGHVCARITEGEGKDLIMPVQLVGEPRKLAHVGDRLVVLYSPQAILSGSPYSFIDYHRRLPVGALTIVYLVLVVAVAGRKGVLSVLGLLVATGVLAFFMIPALLSGSHPLAVTLVGSMAMMLAAVYVAHGVSIRTTTALLGTVAGIVLTVLLALWGTDAAHLTGDVDETARLLASRTHIDLQTLLTCGMVIAGLGVLNDVTITQASSVWELHAANPLLSRTRLFTGGMRIGRDHIASTVYTLAFAYAGTALPLILAAALMDRAVLDTMLSGEIAEEIVRTLISSIGLVLAIPATTAIAAALCRVTPVVDD